jgi:hypothetical protein
VRCGGGGRCGPICWRQFLRARIGAEAIRSSDLDPTVDNGVTIIVGFQNNYIFTGLNN